MIHVVCLKWGTKYAASYVNKLHAMVKRNLRLPFTFYCMTEDASYLNSDITVLPLPDLGICGWWYKLSLFNSNFYGLSGTLFYLDLDVVITGGLDDLLTCHPGSFCIAQDKLPGTYNSSVMRFEIGTMGFVWDSFSVQKQSVISVFHGDQDWIQHLVLQAKIYPRSQIASFKYNCNSRSRFSGGRIGKWLRQQGYLLPYKKALLPEGVLIVLFHGKPDPEEAMKGSYDKYRHAPWITTYWTEE